MSAVPADQIERIVGVDRHPTAHYARAVSAEETVYVLHSAACRADRGDLATCPYSLALDAGIDADQWPVDVPVEVSIIAGFLVPVAGGEQR